MAPNSYRVWTPTEISALSLFIRDRVPTHEIARVLGRTKRAIIAAGEKVLTQQCLHHGSQQMANYYGISLETLHDSIVPLKYYVPVDCAAAYDENSFCGVMFLLKFSVVMLATAGTYVFWRELGTRYPMPY